MKSPIIQSQVKEDLKHIPRGSFAQNMLREYYSVIRQHEQSKSKEEALEEAIGKVKKDNPDFDPDYDHNYFRL